MARSILVALGALAIFSASCAPLLGTSPVTGERLMYEMRVTAPGTRSQGIRGRLFDAEGQGVVTAPNGAVVTESEVPTDEGGPPLATNAGIFQHRPEVHLWDVSGMIPQVMIGTSHFNDPGMSGPTTFRLFVRDACTANERLRGDLLGASGAIDPMASPMETPMGLFSYRRRAGQIGWFPESWPEPSPTGRGWPCSRG